VKNDWITMSFTAGRGTQVAVCVTLAFPPGGNSSNPGAIRVARPRLVEHRVLGLLLQHRYGDFDQYGPAPIDSRVVAAVDSVDTGDPQSGFDVVPIDEIEGSHCALVAIREADEVVDQDLIDDAVVALRAAHLKKAERVVQARGGAAA
jgi:hypothetical protein